MICTGQRFAASNAQERRSSGTIPSARSQLNLCSSTTCENKSHGFWSNNSGQVFQQAPQLTHNDRSIITFIRAIPEMVVTWRILFREEENTNIFERHGLLIISLAFVGIVKGREMFIF
jgi:hypothetical protein